MKAGERGGAEKKEGGRSCRWVGQREESYWRVAGSYWQATGAGLLVTNKALWKIDIIEIK